MKSKDVFIGMVVIPHDKTAGYFNYREWLRASLIETPPLLHVQSWDKFERCWSLGCSTDESAGGLFYAKDFEPYSTPHKIVRVIETGKELTQFHVDGLKVYRWFDVYIATRWSIIRERWPIRINETVIDVYFNGVMIPAYEMDFGNLIEEIK